MIITTITGEKLDVPSIGLILTRSADGADVQSLRIFPPAAIFGDGGAAEVDVDVPLAELHRMQGVAPHLFHSPLSPAMGEYVRIREKDAQQARALRGGLIK